MAPERPYAPIHPGGDIRRWLSKWPIDGGRSHVSFSDLLSTTRFFFVLSLRLAESNRCKMAVNSSAWNFFCFWILLLLWSAIILFPFTFILKNLFILGFWLFLEGIVYDDWSNEAGKYSDISPVICCHWNGANRFTICKWGKLFKSGARSHYHISVFKHALNN